MSKAAIKPGLIPYLHRYLEQKTGEYATLSERWLNGADICRYPPATWPPDRCLLARLPAELLFLICERLYQADLFHLALTCRELACIPTSLLYRRDITDFDCLALRWACTFGVVQTLHRTLDFGAPADHVFDLRSHVRCSWVIGSAGGICGTPLKTAIAANEPEMVQQLLAHGVNVNAARVRAGDKYGLRYGLRYDLLLPINFAIGTPDMPLPQCQLGNPQIVRILLDAGADPNQRSIPSHHVPPDRFSSRPGLPDSYYYFMRGRGMSDVAPLLMAMRATVPVETVKVLLERGADPTLGFDAGRYRFPEQRSSLEVVLTYSLYPAIHDIFPLDLDKIQLLLRYGALTELCDMFTLGSPYSYPMPILYSYWHHPRIADVLKLFISEGADLTSWTEMGVSPVLSAIWWAEDRREHTRFESPVCTKSTAQTTCDVIGKLRDVITLVAQATSVESGPLGPIQRSSIIDAVVSSHIEGLAAHMKGQTALRFVLGPFRFMSATCLAPLLLRYGADMNIADSEGRTALHHAAMFSSGDRVGILVEALGGPASSGLVVDARDAAGWTPLHYACLFGFWANRSGQVTTARLLLENGADVRARSVNGWTPLSLAVFSANLEMVQLLLAHGAHLKDLFVPIGYDNNWTEPTLVPVGRLILLFRNEPGWPGSLSDLGAELVDSKMCIAALLEYRFGVPLDVREGEQRGTVDHPFGTSSVDMLDFTTRNFEESVNRFLAMEAYIISVVPPEV